MTFTPGQLARRAHFYHQWSQLTVAGLGIIQTLEQLERHPPARSYRGPIRKILAGIQQGYTITESMTRLGGWMPEFDLALLHAGEHSGRLDQCFRLLADHYTGRAALARQLLMDLAYPMFLFHFAIFILPFPDLFTTGNISRYLMQTFGVLIPVYFVVFVLVMAGQARHAESWRQFIEEVLNVVPVMGKARRELALSRFAAALEALLSAGMTMIEAWQLAGAASGSPTLKRVVNSWLVHLRAGNTPGELVTASRFFPTMFSGQYATAEISGRLDETLHRLANYYREEGTRKLRAVAQWTPRLIYLVVVGFIAYKIINFYLGYFKMVQDAGGF